MMPETDRAVYTARKGEEVPDKRQALARPANRNPLWHHWLRDPNTADSGSQACKGASGNVSAWK